MQNTSNGHITNSSGRELNQTVMSYWASLGLIGALAVMGNSLVIFLILTRHSLRLHCNWYILSMCAADLLVALTTIPSSFLCHFGMSCDSHVIGLVCDFLLCVSVGTLLTMTLDRYCAVVKPLRYPVLISTRRTFMHVCLGWLIPALLQLIPSLAIFFLPDAVRKRAEWICRGIQMFVFAIIPSLLLPLGYLHIFIIVRGHFSQRQRQTQQLSFNSRARCKTDVPLECNRRRVAAFSLHVIGAMVFLFDLCWAMTIYRGLCDYFKVCVVSNTAVNISRILLLSNSAANPFVYALLKKDIRRELLRSMKRAHKDARKSSGTASLRANRLDLIRMRAYTPASRAEAPPLALLDPGT